MDKMFKILCTQENDLIRPKTFTHLGRNLTFAKTCGQVLDSTFNELCDRVSEYSNSLLKSMNKFKVSCINYRLSVLVIIYKYHNISIQF